MDDRDADTDADLAPHRAYDRIATAFAATRRHPWPEVASFVDDLDDPGLALDVGCGNGRHAGLLAGVADRVVGVDASRELLELARDRAVERGFAAAFRAVRADAARLPLPADRVDAALAIATVHHLRPRARRVRALDDLGRVLAPDGRALVSVWSVDHDRFDAVEGFDTTVDWTLPDGERVPRYYHVYDRDEFVADLADSRCRVVESFVSSGNCYAVVSA